MILKKIQKEAEIEGFALGMLFSNNKLKLSFSDIHHYEEIKKLIEFFQERFKKIRKARNY